MKQLLRMILFALISLFVISARAEENFPRCIASPHHHYLLSAFYYNSNVIMMPHALDDHKAAIQHLDVLYYSSSYLGLVRKNGDFQLADITKQNLITMNEWFKKNHVRAKLILSLGHWSPSSMKEIFTDKKIQTNFINAIIRILKQPDYHLGGIDVDWENFFSPDAKEEKAFPAFMVSLREALHRNGLTNDCLSLDLPVAIPFAKDYPTPKEWVASVDWANLMAYEFYGGNPPYTELDGTLGDVTADYADKPQHYPTVSIASTLTYYASHGIPKRKLVIVLPFYGNNFYLHDVIRWNHFGLRQKVMDDRPSIEATYSGIYYSYGIDGHVKKGSSIHHYTFEQPASAKGTHAYWITHFIIDTPGVGKIYNFISYPDPKAVKEIAQFTKKENYLGLSAWRLCYDLSFDNNHSLLKTIFQEISKK